MTVTTFKNKKNKKFINQYKVLKHLGSGAFASVKLCEDKKTKEMFAIKIMNRERLQRIKQGKDRNAYDCVTEELRVMERLDHPNVIFLKEIIDDPMFPDIMLVTEYHCKGSLG